LPRFLDMALPLLNHPPKPEGGLFAPACGVMWKHQLPSVGPGPRWPGRSDQQPRVLPVGPAHGGVSPPGGQQPADHHRRPTLINPAPSADSTAAAGSRPTTDFYSTCDLARQPGVGLEPHGGWAKNASPARFGPLDPTSRSLGPGAKVL